MSEFSFTMNADLRDDAAQDELLKSTQQAVIQQLREQEDEYILRFFGSMENVLKYGKDYYIEYSQLDMVAGDDNNYHITQTMRMKRRGAISSAEEDHQ